MSIVSVETVMRHVGNHGDQSTFVWTNDATDRIETMLDIHRQEWEEMGRPLHITVTIEPGDKPTERMLGVS